MQSDSFDFEFTTPATRRLLAENSQIDFFAGSFEDESIIEDNFKNVDEEDENPFGNENDTIVEKDIPLLKATRDILLEQNKEMIQTSHTKEIAISVKEAHQVTEYPDIAFDRILLERALDTCDYTRIQVAADRIIRTSQHYQAGIIPADVLQLKSAIESISRHATSVDDRRGFEFALAHADWNMTRLLGNQILDFVQQQHGEMSDNDDHHPQEQEEEDVVVSPTSSSSQNNENASSILNKQEPRSVYI
mmetsp:Transcript_12444/g.18671  ORF Transcript_12444/g.18671 Transcript_12444/m.18671 type:complete len:248 (-) Transcript_12444:1758-2501(-)|eukprot:CAMPEP_0197320636 /NCGR_PEP_ID=MMETSP0891-20130614/61095_1 /TAXON_ID=44058 ORGANISM="Aureoumbra lagunensis, Strain CCMP1510" /NCGR_SAMPLE_ID=MMETSP0891 /ASSEMBLY_ACC=CAM_ASM_000534 /LENGTH=247 /DNA_ID=CAMNT_0042812137 /DNA_START=9 /DNA_END=752 /DNA_ORIENTATION=+